MKFFISVFIVVILISIMAVIRLSAFDLSDDGEQRSIIFRHQHDVLQGT